MGGEESLFHGKPSETEDVCMAFGLMHVVFFCSSLQFLRSGPVEDILAGTSSPSSVTEETMKHSVPLSHTRSGLAPVMELLLGTKTIRTFLII